MPFAFLPLITLWCVHYLFWWDVSATSEEVSLDHDSLQLSEELWATTLNSWTSTLCLTNLGRLMDGTNSNNDYELFTCTAPCQSQARPTGCMGGIDRGCFTSTGHTTLNNTISMNEILEVKKGGNKFTLYPMQYTSSMKETMEARPTTRNDTFSMKAMWEEKKGVTEVTLSATKFPTTIMEKSKDEPEFTLLAHIIKDHAYFSEEIYCPLGTTAKTNTEATIETGETRVDLPTVIQMEIHHCAFRQWGNNKSECHHCMFRQWGDIKMDLHIRLGTRR